MMTPTEIKLRAALVWIQHESRGGPIMRLPASLDFVPSGPVKVLDKTTVRPHLRWNGDGRLVTVSTTPGGRVLYVVDAYLDHHSATHSARLPREFWPESPMPPRFPDTSCSSCGLSFGPGDHGYSHCEHHAHLVGRE